MKTLRIISIILLFALFTSLLIHGLNSINQDIGRHIKSGQIIWETKKVYKTNLFSFTEPNNPFIDHHWLSEVAFYGLNNAIGLKGLILFKAGIILIALTLIFLSVYPQTKFWPLALSSLVGFTVFIERMDVRPEIFSYLFLAFFIFAIFKAKNESNYKYLYFLPLTQILWTNMHIYFAIGPILLLFFTIDRFFEKREFFKKTGLILIATSAATLLNPNFIRGALVPFNILRNYGYSIVENQNIFFLRDYGISLMAINIFEISLVVLIFSFIVGFKNRRRKSLFEILTSIFIVVMAGKMIRNFGIYALTFIPIVALNLSTLTPLTTRRVVNPQLVHRWRGFGHSMSKHFYPAISVLLIFLIWNNINSPRFGLTIPTGAEKAVEFIKNNNIKGPVFNNFDVGSFLIWKMYPEQRVFVDGRPEAYSVDFFEKIYKPMQKNPAIWEKYSEQYKINYVFFGHQDITPWAQKFLATISKNPDWPLIYSDQSVVIFIKRTIENKNLVSRFKIDTP